ncbi:MAG: ASCH domain-containing protein [Gemmatales bacterium]|nr:ASCH domain-containing protein [Gemmatales bacterium]MDW8385442.1 ASCH domain-containing protein [Gemmatales bacterium]
MARQRKGPQVSIAQQPEYALSLKQPWAALVVLGFKTIEVRRWPTDRRGPILIHASQTADERDEVWQRVPPAARGLAELRGGIIGQAELVDCITYDTREAFRRDEARHWNRADWFRPPRLYGFVFRHPKLLPFRPVLGWMRFFRPETEQKMKRTRK